MTDGSDGESNGGDGDSSTGRSDAAAGSTDVDPETTFGRDALAADLRAVLSWVESIHAEPYHGYDGRIQLHRAFESAVRDLPETATVEAFYRRAAPLVAGLDDTHSKLVAPDRETEESRLPLSFRVVGSSLYVEAVHAESLADLLGGQLRSVAGEPVDAMADRGASLRGAENRYAALRHLGRSLGEYDAIDRLLGETTPPRTPTLTVESPDGTEHRRTIDPVPADREPALELDTTVEAPAGTGPRYRLYEGGEGAVFVPGDLMGYREVIEGARDRGAAYAGSIARDAYATFEDNPAGYDFGSEFRLAETDHDARAERFEADFGAGTFGAELEARDHEGYYTPDEIVVVTSEGTMSSAFAGAALLSELGADLVGVPSGQAPVSFGETIERTLPNTGLAVELSGSMYRWVPDPSGTVLPMDRELTPDLFEGRYDRAYDAALRLAFEHADLIAPGGRPEPR